jgi:hypothetical protein
MRTKTKSMVSVLVLDNALVDDPGLPYHGPYIGQRTHHRPIEALWIPFGKPIFVHSPTVCPGIQTDVKAMVACLLSIILSNAT